MERYTPSTKEIEPNGTALLFFLIIVTAFRHGHDDTCYLRSRQSYPALIFFLCIELFSQPSRSEISNRSAIGLFTLHRSGNDLAVIGLSLVVELVFQVNLFLWFLRPIKIEIDRREMINRFAKLIDQFILKHS